MYSMKKIVYFILGLTLCSNALAQSDDCSGAVNLTPGATCTTTAFSNTENGQPEAGTPNPSCMTGTENLQMFGLV